MRRICLMRSFAALVLCAAMSLLMAADKADKDAKDNPDKKEAKSDQHALQGTWRCVKVVHDGQETDEHEVKDHPVTLKFEGDAVTWHHVRPDGEEETRQGTFTLDVDKKPARITVKPKEATESDKSLIGIYELKADTLKLAFRHGEQADTATEDFKGGDGIAVLTFQRQAAKDKGKDSGDEKK